jgi:hypothetical protein
MALRFVLPLLAILGQTRSTQLHIDPRVLIVQTAAQSYKAGIAAAEAKQWDVAANDFRQAIERDPNERPGYFPHYWLGVADDELHQTAKAFAEWRESQRQGAIKGTPEEAAMKKRMLAHMQMASHPTDIVLPLPLPPPPPPPQPPVILTQTFPTETSAVVPTTTMTETEAMTTATAATTTTGTATTTEHQHDPTTPEGQLFNEIDQRFKALNPGKVLISAPHEMRVAVAQPFVVRIAAANQSDGINSDLPAGGQTHTSTMLITPTMRATLDGAGFAIQRTSDERQFIGGGSFTEWSWQVTPAESGNRELVVTVYVELDTRSKGFATRWPVHVSANTGQSVSHFFATYWQWLLTTLIIPLVLFWRRQKTQT